MSRTRQPPRYSEHQFEEIELSPFRKHLPLRPDKPSVICDLWRSTSIRIALAAILSVLMIICAAVVAFSIGKSIQSSYCSKHPDPAPIFIVTPSLVTAVQITQSNVATSIAETLVSSWQSKEVATATVIASATAA